MHQLALQLYYPYLWWRYLPSQQSVYYEHSFALQLYYPCLCWRYLGSQQSVYYEHSCINWPYNCTIRVYDGATLLVSSHFTTSIHCTIRVFVVNHFCDGVWSLLVEANLCRLSLSFGYICISVGDPVFSLLRLTSSYFQRCEIFLSCTSARQNNHVRFTGKCMLYSLCQLPPEFSMLFLFKINN